MMAVSGRWLSAESDGSAREGSLFILPPLVVKYGEGSMVGSCSCTASNGAGGLEASLLRTSGDAVGKSASDGRALLVGMGEGISESEIFSGSRA